MKEILQVAMSLSNILPLIVNSEPYISFCFSEIEDMVVVTDFITLYFGVTFKENDMINDVLRI